MDITELLERRVKESMEKQEKQLKEISEYFDYLFGERLLYRDESYVVLALRYGEPEISATELGHKIESEVTVVLGKNFTERIELPLREVVECYRRTKIQEVILFYQE